MKDITGQRNGRLTAIRPLYKDKNGAWHWECKCDCGKTTVVSIGNFKPNRTKSCGCIITEHALKMVKQINTSRLGFIKKVDSLVGQVFGDLTVVDLTEVSTNYSQWECRCICGNTIIASRTDLKRGKKTSCGCKDIKNEYEFTSDTCIGYTSDNKPFLVDIDKFDLICNYYWYIDDNGYVRNCNGVKLHRLVTNASSGMDVDHKHGEWSRFDNRSSNLRECSKAENSRNRPPHKNNKLGVKGVSQQGKNKYRVEIQFNHQRIKIGVFNTLKEAADAYDAKAKELFGEYAWLNNYNEKENDL